MPRARRGCRRSDTTTEKRRPNEKEKERERAARISSVVQKIKSHRPSLRGIECRNTGLSGPSPLIFVTRHRSSFRENYSTALMPREYTALNRRTFSSPSSLFSSSFSFSFSRCTVRVCSRYQLFALVYAHTRSDSIATKESSTSTSSLVITNG